METNDLSLQESCHAKILESVVINRKRLVSASYYCLRVCLKIRLARSALRLEFRLQAVCAWNRLKAELQTGVFKQALRKKLAIAHLPVISLSSNAR